MKNFLRQVGIVMLALGLLPSWLLATLMWFYGEGDLMWVSPVLYAEKVIEARSHLNLAIAIFCWLIIKTIVHFIRN